MPVVHPCSYSAGLAAVLGGFTAPALFVGVLADFLAVAQRLSCPSRIFSLVSALMTLRFSEDFLACLSFIVFAALPTVKLDSVAESKARAC